MKIVSLVTARSIEYIITPEPPAAPDFRMLLVQGQVPCKAILGIFENGQRLHVVHMHDGTLRRVYDGVETRYVRDTSVPGEERQ